MNLPHLLLGVGFQIFIVTPQMFTFSLEYVENVRSQLLLQPQMHITLLVPSEDSMAAIWVVFGHLAVISKNERWLVNNGDLNPES